MYTFESSSDCSAKINPIGKEALETDQCVTIGSNTYTFGVSRLPAYSGYNVRKEIYSNDRDCTNVSTATIIEKEYICEGMTRYYVSNDKLMVRTFSALLTPPPLFSSRLTIISVTPIFPLLPATMAMVSLLPLSPQPPAPAPARTRSAGVSPRVRLQFPLLSPSPPLALLSPLGPLPSPPVLLPSSRPVPLSSPRRPLLSRLHRPSPRTIRLPLLPGSSRPWSLSWSSLLRSKDLKIMC